MARLSLTKASIWPKSPLSRLRNGTNSSKSFFQGAPSEHSEPCLPFSSNRQWKRLKIVLSAHEWNVKSAGQVECIRRKAAILASVAPHSPCFLRGGLHYHQLEIHHHFSVCKISMGALTLALWKVHFLFSSLDYAPAVLLHQLKCSRKSWNTQMAKCKFFTNRRQWQGFYFYYATRTTHSRRFIICTQYIWPFAGMWI